MNTNEKVAMLVQTYAQVLFDLAVQSQAVDAVKDDLDALANLAAQEREFETLMGSPCITEQEKKRLVQSLFSGKLHELTMDFLMVVIEHNRAMFLPQVITRYNDLWESYDGCRRVKVIVAKAMSSDESGRLAEDMAAAMNSKVKLELAVDPSIIGGVIIRYDDKVIDNTVRGRLQHAVKTITSQRKPYEAGHN